MWTKQVGLAAFENSHPAKKAPEFCAVSKEMGAKLGSLSWWREFRLQHTKHQPKLMNVAADIPATAGIIFRNFLSGKRRFAVQVPRTNMTRGLLC
jgi:hypothetical protein